MRTSISLALTLMLVSTAGCDLYFGGGGDDDPCLWGGGGGGASPGTPLDLRDPETGQCINFGDGGTWCDDACGPCAYDEAPADEAAVAVPSWGVCDSYCTGLGESQCLATPGCRGAYVETCIEEEPYPCDPSEAPAFFECWATDQSGPVQGSCEGLDAWSCSLHDDCIAIHQDGCGDPLPSGDGEWRVPVACGTGQFLQCASEPAGCYSDSDCGAGTHCTADIECLPPPGCETMDPSGDPSADPAPPGISECEAACYGSCVPDGQVGCWEEVWCDGMTPACPPDSVPAVKDHCYTGECIAVELCGDPPPPPPPPAACVELAEEECIYSSYCGPVYTGIGCSCDAGGCTCLDWQFHICTDLGE